MSAVEGVVAGIAAVAAGLRRAVDEVAALDVAVVDALARAEQLGGHAMVGGLAAVHDDVVRMWTDAAVAHRAALETLERARELTSGASTGVTEAPTRAPATRERGSPQPDIGDGASLQGATRAEVASAARRAGWTYHGRSRDGNGDVWRHPVNKGEQIIVNDGYAWARDPIHRRPYVKISRAGTKTRYPLSEG